MANDSSFLINKLNKASADVSRSFAKLASGKRINSAADDAAGLAIADALSVDVRTSNQAQRNISDAGSAIAITDGALDQISQIGSRLSELATQSANGTLSDGQRQALDSEFQSLSQEAQRIAATTQFNGTNLLDGSQLTVQAGTGSDANSQISTSGANGASLAAALSTLSVANVDSARTAVDQVASFVSSVSSTRGAQGAVASRLDVASESVSTRAINEQAAESRIRDADIAEETSRLVAARIRQDATSSALNAHKLSQQSVLKLLS